MTTRRSRAAPVLDRLIQLPGVITQGDDDRFGHPTFEEGPEAHNLGSTPGSKRAGNT